MTARDFGSPCCPACELCGQALDNCTCFSEPDSYEFEYEPNREELAWEARAEPEGRWGDE